MLYCMDCPYQSTQPLLSANRQSSVICSKALEPKVLHDHFCNNFGDIQDKVVGDYKITLFQTKQ